MDSMGVDISDAISGIWIFLLFGLSATFIIVSIYLYTENKLLKNENSKLRLRLCQIQKKYFI